MSLDALVSPRSIAVIDVAGDPAAIGTRVLANLRHSFAGSLVQIRVEPGGERPLVGRAGTDAIDLAIVAAPAEMVPGIVADCGASGAGAAIVCTTGFAPTGLATDNTREALRSSAERSGIRILGPNCLGLISMPARMRATFAAISFEERMGNVAIVGQSGALGLLMYELALDAGLGVSYWFGTGREVDVCAAELAGHLLERDEVDVLALVLEGVNRPDLLLAAGRRGAHLGKPVVVIKVGRSPSGAMAAASHSAAVAVPSRVFEAACESAAITLARSPREMLDLIRAFSLVRAPAGRRLAVVTGSGGVGVMMADAADGEGLELPAPDAPLRRDLAKVLPALGAAGNPIDYAGSDFVEDRSALRSIIVATASSSEFDAVCIAGVPETPAHYRETVRDVGLEVTKPYLVYSHRHETARELTRSGVATITDPYAAMHAIGALVRFSERRSSIAAAGDRASARGVRRGSIDRPGGSIVDHDARSMLERCGIAFAREEQARSPQEAAAAATVIGYPVAVKLSADWLPHRSDLGAVRLGLADETAVLAAATELVALARVHSAYPARLVVQAMVPGGIELMCGMIRDPTFGAVVTLGAGGTLVEIIAEQQLALAPVAPAEAVRLATRLWEGRLAEHHRGIAASAIESLAGVVAAIGELALDEPRIETIDVNPLIVDGERMVAIDALIVLGN